MEKRERRILTAWPAKTAEAVLDFVEASKDSKPGLTGVA
jgi:hypothetical protein